jgi:hypothetical protein
VNHIYQNKYGRLEIEIAGPYQPVSSIKSKDIDEKLFFSIDDAEKIILITGNEDIQLGFAEWEFSTSYLIHHSSPNSAAVGRIVSLDFDKNISARDELYRPNPYRGPLLY